MKRILCCILLFRSILGSAQEKVELALSPKPSILINGNACNILNTIWSCTTRVCDSVEIMEGDSIEFCTATQIDLTVDTAYWIQWNFIGSSNYPNSVTHAYFYPTPYCLYPKWDIAGDYYCDIFYNGWLSAYPNSDCYSQGPSHWIVHVIVHPNPSSVIEYKMQEPEVFPNPCLSGKQNSNGKIQLKHTDQFHGCAYSIRNVIGDEMMNGKLTDEEMIDISSLASGLYFLHLSSESAEVVKKIILQ